MKQPVASTVSSAKGRVVYNRQEWSRHRCILQADAHWCCVIRNEAVIDTTRCAQHRESPPRVRAVLLSQVLSNRVVEQRKGTLNRLRPQRVCCGRVRRFGPGVLAFNEDDEKDVAAYLRYHAIPLWWECLRIREQGPKCECRIRWARMADCASSGALIRKR